MTLKGSEHLLAIISSSETSRRFEAPARVNLIGEHTDCTGGCVLPMAIPFRTVALISPGKEPEQYTFVSEFYQAKRHMASSDRSGAIQDWTDYPVGVLRELQEMGIEPPPFTLKIAGNVPPASGLSSSASIEVATAIALLAFLAGACRLRKSPYFASELKTSTWVRLAESWTSSSSRPRGPEYALLLDTRDLTYEHLPMNRGRLTDCRIVVANSMVKHSIAGGDYGIRRREAELGQSVLRDAFPGLRDLGDATLAQLASCESAMSQEGYKRCRHIISENGRVNEARAAMIAGDPEHLGSAMADSHISQRDDFECSIEEIDFLVETALALDGCYGSRLTGGGFGGCTVSLVEASRSERFCLDLQKKYRERFGIGAETYICDAADGAVERFAKATPEPEETFE